MFSATVDLLDMGDSGNEAAAIRETLEGFDLRVHRYPIGRARHIVEAVAAAGGEYLIMVAHGGEGGIYVPELASELAVHEPFDRLMTVADIRQHLRFNGQTVITAACSSGTPELAGAFLNAGAEAYIAPEGDILGTAALFGVIRVMYELAVLGRPPHEALANVAATDTECALFRLFAADLA